MDYAVRGQAPHLKLQRCQSDATAERQRDKQKIKSQRLHDENTKRAYIAASRRTDRSEEARITSAHRASEIHKKITGKSLKISKEIVLNDKMYEEEDVSDSVLSPPSAVQMEQFQREAMINRLFEQYFTGTTQKQRKCPTKNEKSLEDYEGSSIARLTKRRCLSPDPMGRPELTFCHKEEPFAERHFAPTYPRNSSLNISINRAGHKRKALAQNAIPVNQPWAEPASDYNPQPATIATDADALLELDVSPSPWLIPSLAINNLQTKPGLSDGIMNEDMRAADWINLSELQVGLGET